MSNPASQGLVGAGMNRRGPLSAMEKSYLIKGVSSFGGRQFSTILLSVHLKSDLIRGVAFGGRDYCISKNAMRCRIIITLKRFIL